MRRDHDVSDAWLPIDALSVLWDYHAVTITADSKKRVVMPRIKRGDILACEPQDKNHYSLVRLQSVPPPAIRTKAEVRLAIKNSKLLFDVTWDELRALTREP